MKRTDEAEPAALVLDSACVDQTFARAPAPSFDDFYVREWSGVAVLAHSLSGSFTAGEELAQDAFVAAYRNWERVSGLDRPEAWVRRVVANAAVSTLRRRGAEARARLRLRSIREREPAAVLFTSEQEEFWDAVRSLPKRQAQAVALHYLEDRPVAEIAEIIGCAENTVKVHLHRGRTALAERLGLTPRGNT